MGKIGEEVLPYIPPVSYTAGLKVVRYTICSMKTRYIMSSQMVKILVKDFMYMIYRLFEMHILGLKFIFLTGFGNCLVTVVFRNFLYILVMNIKMQLAFASSLLSFGYTFK